jgi:glycosyltransferase involved in cell wall biosynthesis
MIYLILPRGSQFGWGICGKYLVKELSELTEISYITETFDLNDIGDELDFHFLKNMQVRHHEMGLAMNEPGGKVDHPVLKAITDESLQPWMSHLKGNFTAGYTFFEMNVLAPQDIQHSRENFDIIVTGSKWCEEVLRNHGLNDVITIIQGTDPQLFNPAHAEKELFKDRFVVFSGGKFELRKGQDIVIKAYKILQDRHPDVMLINAWYNPWPFSMQTMAASPYINCDITDSDYLKAINNIFLENGIDLNRVINVLPRQNAQMARLYKNTDVGLFPNRCEGGTNLVLMEYMSCGKPVIASFSSGHQDILNPSNSILIKNMKPLNITSRGALQAVWDDPDLDETIDHLEKAYQNRDNLSLIGQQAGSDMAHFTWKKTGREFYNLLRNQGA